MSEECKDCIHLGKSLSNSCACLLFNGDLNHEDHCQSYFSLKRYLKNLELLQKAVAPQSEFNEHCRWD